MGIELGANADFRGYMSWYGNLIFSGIACICEKKHVRHIPTKIISLLVSVAMFVGCFYLYQTKTALDKILGLDYQTQSIAVYVKNESPAQNIYDLEGKTVAVNVNFDKEKSDEAILKINELIDEDINIVLYDTFQEMVDVLYSGEVDAILMNEAFSAITNEYKETFSDDTRIIYAHQTNEVVKKEEKVFDMTEDTFTVYISGIDTYGPVSTVSRSDVNILMTINPKTHQILLTNIPRDYYVTLHSFGALDKLTHAGIYGVIESMQTLEDLLEIEIDGYIRVNFSSVVEIVDALGGITVENPRAFLNYPAGTIHLNGKEALGFSRERYSFSAGDRERGRNQQRVIIGIINKVLSPSIISNYTGILNAVSNSFQTSISSDDLSKLVQMQFEEMAGWEVMTCSLDGSGASEVTYSYGSQPLYVMVPNLDTVDAAKRYISTMETGGRITVD